MGSSDDVHVGAVQRNTLKIRHPKTQGDNQRHRRADELGPALVKVVSVRVVPHHDPAQRVDDNRGIEVVQVS